MNTGIGIVLAFVVFWALFWRGRESDAKADQTRSEFERARDLRIRQARMHKHGGDDAA